MPFLIFRSDRTGMSVNSFLMMGCIALMVPAEGQKLHHQAGSDIIKQ